MAVLDLEEVNKNNGKCYLAVENNKAIGLIMGCIFPYDEYDYLDYKCPKRGEITELIVTNKIRSKGIGQELINKMEEYFKSINMPTSIKELGINPTAEQLIEMSKKCSKAVNGTCGSIKKLHEIDMLTIYKNALK